MVCAYLIALGLHHVLDLTSHHSIVFEVLANFTDTFTRGTLLVVAVLTFTLQRFISSNPLLDGAYGRFLRQTPWRAGDGSEPLPRGPVWPTGMDFAGIAGLSLLAWGIEGWSWWMMPTLAIALLLLYWLWPQLQNEALTAAVLAALPLCWWPWVGPWQIGVVLLTLLLATGWTMARRLRAFPYDEPDWRQRSLRHGSDDETWWHEDPLAHAAAGRGVGQMTGVGVQLQSPTNVGSATGNPPVTALAGLVGQPLADVGPAVPVPSLRRADAWVLALTAGWYVWTIQGLLLKVLHPRGDRFWFDLLTGDSPEFLAKAWLIFGCGVALARFAVYAFAGRPVLSWRARLATHRLRLPGYDAIYRGPAAVLAVAGLVALPLRLGADPRLPLTFGVATLVLAALRVGPRLNHWRLAGRCRMPLREVNAKAGKRKSSAGEIRVDFRFAGRRF